MNDLFKQLQALALLAETATAGPWEVIPNSEHTDSVHSTEANHVENFGLGEFRSSNLCMNTGGFAHNSDAALIVAFRNVLTPESLQALRAALAPVAGWVSLDKQAPPRDTEVLVLTSSGDMEVNYIDADGPMDFARGYNDYDHYTHWMPLPTPPALTEGAQPRA